MGKRRESLSFFVLRLFGEKSLAGSEPLLAYYLGSGEVAASTLRSSAICNSRALVCRSREASLLFLFRESDLLCSLSPLRPWS